LRCQPKCFYIADIPCKSIFFSVSSCWLVQECKCLRKEHEPTSSLYKSKKDQLEKANYSCAVASAGLVCIILKYRSNPCFCWRLAASTVGRMEQHCGVQVESLWLWLSQQKRMHTTPRVHVPCSDSLNEHVEGKKKI